MAVSWVGSMRYNDGGDCEWSELADIVRFSSGELERGDFTHNTTTNRTSTRPIQNGSASLLLQQVCLVRPWVDDDDNNAIFGIQCLVQILSDVPWLTTEKNEAMEGNLSSSVASTPQVLMLRMHPLLYEFLSAAATASTSPRDTNALERDQPASEESRQAAAAAARAMQPVFLSPIPTHSFDIAAPSLTGDTLWGLKPVGDIADLPEGSRLFVRILYDTMDDSQEILTPPNTKSCGEGNVAVLVSSCMTRKLSIALQGRLVRSDCTILLTVPSFPASGSATVEKNGLRNDSWNHVLAIVQRIDVPTSTGASYEACRENVFRVSDNPSLYTLNIVSSPLDLDNNATGMESLRSASRRNPLYALDSVRDCPGYETMVDSLVNLLLITTASTKTNVNTSHLNLAEIAPSGILVTGCAGVGKTRLVAAASVNRSAHWISIHDAILMAAWATQDMLLASLQPPMGYQVLIFDDLDAIGSSGGDSGVALHSDFERRLVLNAITQTLDKLSSNPNKQIAVLGISQEASLLPSELVRVGRFEKEVKMLPPSQSQRELILHSMLTSIPAAGDENESGEWCRRARKWAELLATMTPGFVAADLRRLCADAWYRSITSCLAEENIVVDPPTSGIYPFAPNIQDFGAELSWDDLYEAARDCSPSQLAALDVTKPSCFLNVCDANDWQQIHQLSWKSFVGYPNIKKRVYRTVVLPWRRMLQQGSDEQNLPESISPPAGVLFHGSSGCGKTMAANCLGSSLGLPMIKVRAADILDKWLGGSEAAIRSLFSRARSAAPSILFFDEIDAIATNRANAEEGGTGDVMSRLLSTLLNEMDGVSGGGQLSNVLVIACTNRLDTLDAALIRPGRLEEHVHITKPSCHDSLEILNSSFELAPLHESVALDGIARLLAERSATCADIEGTCRESVFRAFRRCTADLSNVCVTNDDITGAMATMKIIEDL